MNHWRHECIHVGTEGDGRGRRLMFLPSRRPCSAWASSNSSPATARASRSCSWRVSSSSRKPAAAASCSWRSTASQTNRSRIHVTKTTRDIEASTSRHALCQLPSSPASRHGRLLVRKVHGRSSKRLAFSRHSMSRLALARMSRLVATLHTTATTQTTSPSPSFELASSLASRLSTVIRATSARKCCACTWMLVMSA